jgi:hypothetical protein
MTPIATSAGASTGRPLHAAARRQVLILAAGASAVLFAVAAIVLHVQAALAAHPSTGVVRVRADEECGRMLDAIVAADMGGDAKARQAARSALRASPCQLGHRGARS